MHTVYLNVQTNHDEEESHQISDNNRGSLHESLANSTNTNAARIFVGELTSGASVHSEVIHCSLVCKRSQTHTKIMLNPHVQTPPTG